MLRKIRIGISALLFVLISFFFLDFAEILPNSFHRLAHLQFVRFAFIKCRYLIISHCVNTFIRPYLLFDDMSYGDFARYHCAPVKINK